MSYTNTLGHASGPNAESYTPERIYAGDFPVQSRAYTVEMGQVLTQFQVVARETASGKIVAWNPGSADAGTKAAIGVTSYAIDATAADVVGSVIVAGHFNTAALNFNGATAAQIEAAFDGLPLFHSAVPSA